MTSTIAKKTGLKLFEQHLRQYEPADPVYETYIDNKGKERRRKVGFSFILWSVWFVMADIIPRGNFLLACLLVMPRSYGKLRVVHTTWIKASAYAG